MTISRREFGKMGAFAWLSAMSMQSVIVRNAFGKAVKATLPANKIPQFVDQLPVLAVDTRFLASKSNTMEVSGAAANTLTMQEFKAHILPTGLFAPGVKPQTTVWGYRISGAPALADTYIGPVSDTGGFGKKNDQEIRLLWKIYELFDILSMNEREFQKLCNVFSIGGDEEQKLSRLLEFGQNLQTIWLHTRDYQMCIASQFGPKKLAKAQEFSSAAGCLRVETGGFPSNQEIESRSIPSRSTSFRNVVRTNSLKIRSFKTEVGAGEVSAAAFLWNLLTTCAMILCYPRQVFHIFFLLYLMVISNSTLNLGRLAPILMLYLQAV